MNRLMDTLRVSLVGMAVGALALGGCSESGSEHADHGEHSEHADHASEHGTVSDAVRFDVYQGIRGELMSLPVEGGEAAKIHHMQITEFKGADGKVPVTADGISGMRSMTMPFPMADGVSLGGFAAGDKVEFSFKVKWENGRASWEVTEIEKLDASTGIDFSNVKVEP